jgi:hypothetical protein
MSIAEAQRFKALERAVDDLSARLERVEALLTKVLELPKPKNNRRPANKSLQTSP